METENAVTLEQVPVTVPTYTTGKEFQQAVDTLTRFIQKDAVGSLLLIVNSEISLRHDALRLELHNKLEKVVKGTEEERMQAMTELERRITKSIAENTRKDTIRFRWVVTAVAITLVNLTALSILVIKAWPLLQLKGQ